MTRASTGKIKTDDGLSLFYRRWPGEADSPVLLFVHGMGEHSGRYQNPVHYFQPKGYSVYAYDQRGQGRSDGPRMYAERFARLLGDLDDVIDFVKEREGDKPLFLVGHSFGGQVVLNYAARHPNGIQGVAVSSPNVRLAMPVPFLKKQLGLLVSRVLPTMPVPAGLKSEFLSHDPDVVRAYDEDPLVNGCISVRLASEMFANQDIMLKVARTVSCPILLMHAGDDQICDPQGTKDFYQACASPDKTFKLYAGAYHELFNDIDKVEVFDDMETWFKGHQ